MSNLSCAEKFGGIVKTLPRLDLAKKEMPLFQKQVETDLIEDLEELNSRLEQCNSENLACALAQALDKDQTKIEDLDDNGLPKELLTHFGDTFPSHGLRGDLAKFMSYFNRLVKFGFEHQDNTNMKTVLDELVETSYQFIKDFASEVKSQVSMILVACSLSMSLEDKYKKNESRDKNNQFEKYLSEKGIDCCSLMDEQEKDLLWKYSSSILSQSNEELIKTLYKLVEYHSLEWLDNGDIILGAKLVEQYFGGEITKEDFNQKYLEFVRSLDKKLEEAGSYGNDEYQKLQMSLITMREFIALDYDEGAWRDRVHQLQENLIPDNPEDDY